MKILIAPDSFKDALSSVKIAQSIKKGLSYHISKKDLQLLPLSDGGDGFLETLYYGAKTIKKYTVLRQENSKPLRIPYLLSDDYKTAFIESALCTGKKIFHNGILERNSFLLGTLLKKLIKKGLKNFVIGLGGSATNDLGIGLLSAMDVVFYDKFDNPVSPLPKNLNNIDYLDLSKFDNLIRNCNFTILCDVENPITGKNGAAKTYAKQKGASKDEIEFLEDATLHYLQTLNKIFGWEVKDEPKLGSAGGLGFAFKYFFKGKLLSGFDFVSNIINLPDKISKSDFVITGEGQLDYQSNFGKVTRKVISLCKNYDKKYLILTGTTPEILSLHDNIIDISSLSFDLPYSIAHTKELLIHYSKIVGYLIKSGGKI